MSGKGLIFNPGNLMEDREFENLDMVDEGGVCFWLRKREGVRIAGGSGAVGCEF